MTFYLIPPLVTSVSFTILGLGMFIARPRAVEVRAYAVWCLATVYWQVCWAVLFAPHNPSLFFVNLLIHIGYSGIIFIPIGFYHFALAFVHARNWARKTAIAYSIGCIFVLTVWFTNSFVSGTYHRSWGYYPKVSYLHSLYLVFLSYLVVDGLRILFQERRRPGLSEHQKLQYSYILCAAGIYLFASVDFAVNYGLDVYPFGFIFTLISLSIIGFAIARHHLMDINIILRRTVIYTAVTATVTVLYVVVIMVFEKLGEHSFHTSSIWSSLIAAAIITLFFLPLRTRIQRFVDRYFFKNTLDENLLQEMTRGIAHEIRRPLANIAWPAEMTLMDLEDLKTDIPAKTYKNIRERLEYLIAPSKEASHRI